MENVEFEGRKKMEQKKMKCGQCDVEAMCEQKDNTKKNM